MMESGRGGGGGGCGESCGAEAGWSTGGGGAGGGSADAVVAFGQGRGFRAGAIFAFCYYFDILGGEENVG